ncbi:hypothetical protein WSM22_05320 [Cytophagales bacterium WSM2-2]|nr:hypothetical protein WSM22_05320 [Cytophagales bacterium WSM2-2]
MKFRIFIFFVISLEVTGQDFPRKEINPATLVDEIFAAQEVDVSYQDLYENYVQLISNPLDLNLATEEQLQTLYLLKQEQIHSIVKYREETGLFISLYELQTILDSDTFHRIIPFVIVPDATQSFNKSIFKRILSEPNNYLILRWGRTLETQKGYDQNSSPSTQYKGSPDNLYARFRVSRSGDFSLGFTSKKDAGELIDWNPSQKNYGFDYLSYHLQLSNKGKVKNLILGDYQAQFGQGVTLGSFFGVGKNSEAVTSMRKANLGFLPYTSTYEAGYFRGAAISYSLGKTLTFHAMASRRGRDGNLQQDTVATGLDYLSSFNYSGLHRTSAEVENRDAITETNLAGVFQFKKQSADAGLIFHHTGFSTPLIRKPSVYNQFEFNGDANTNAGLYLNYNFYNFSFFSELTQTIGHGKALVAGVLGSLSPKFDMSIVYRRFDKDFYSFYSNAIAENSTPQNESGMFWGWKYSFSKKYSVSGYFDLFTFPWLKYRNYSPSDGNEWLLRFNYKPSKTVAIFMQMRQESKQRNTGVESNLYLTDQGVKQNYSINADYAVNARLSLRTRVQFSSYSLAGKHTTGSVLLQDITYDLGRISISGRYTLFDTDDYDNRIYVYERDALLAFSFPAYYGKGIRNYILLHYRLTPRVDFWVRWARTLYTTNGAIGSGGETINGNSRNDVKFQARIRF